MHYHIRPFGAANWLRLLLGGLILSAGVAGAAPATPFGPAWTAAYDAPERFNEGNDVVVDSDGNAYAVGRSVADRVAGLSDLAIVKYNSAGRRLWVRTYPVPGGLGPTVRAALDGDDAIVVAGASRNDITQRDFLVVKYDSEGEFVWDFTFNSTNNGNDVPSTIAVDGMGAVYVSGTGDTLGVFSTDALTFKLDPEDGEVVWQNRLSGNTTDSHFILDSFVDDPDPNRKDDPLGGLFVTGRVVDQLEERDAGSFFTRRFDATNGDVLWDAVYDGPGIGADSAVALAFTPDRHVVVTGSSVGLDDTLDFATVKYDSLDGTQLWERRYNGPARGADAPSALALDAAGNVYVTGSSASTAARALDYTTIAYNGLNGNPRWVSRYDGPGSEDTADGFFDLPVAIAVDPAGNATVTGQVSMGNARFAVGTVQYGPTGRQQWVHLFNGPGRNDIGTALALDDMASPFVVGTSVTNSLDDDRSLLTLKYLSTGRRPAAKPTFTFSESSRDRLVCRREMGSQVCEEETARTFKINSSAALENMDLDTFGPATPFEVEVGGFTYAGTLADDPRYRSGRTSAVFTETVQDGGRERKSLTVNFNWAGGRLRVSVVGAALYPEGILAADFVDEPTARITDSTTATVSLGSFTQAFDVAVSGRVTTRPAQAGAFSLSTVTLSGKNSLP